MSYISSSPKEPSKQFNLQDYQDNPSEESREGSQMVKETDRSSEELN